MIRQLPVDIDERFESASLVWAGSASFSEKPRTAQRRFWRRDSIWKEKVSFPGAIRAEGKLRNLGIPGMGKRRQAFPVRDGVGPFPGIP